MAPQTLADPQGAPNSRPSPHHVASASRRVSPEAPLPHAPAQGPYPAALRVSLSNSDAGSEWGGSEPELPHTPPDHVIGRRPRTRPLVSPSNASGSAAGRPQGSLRSQGSSGCALDVHDGDDDDDSDAAAEAAAAAAPAELSSALPGPWALSHWRPFGVAAAVTALATVGLFADGGRPCARWYPALYACVALGALLGLFLAAHRADRRFLRGLGADVPAYVSAGAASADPRVRYVQARIRERLAADARAAEEAAARRADPLHFLRGDLARWAGGGDGYAVVDAAGVVLWTNDALRGFLGRRADDLAGANVRVLMPPPYAAQHDGFLRRHLATGDRNVLGGERAVPVLKGDGTQAIVRLAVEDRVDPVVPENRLFVGRMRFTVDDPVIEGFHDGIRPFRSGGRRPCHGGGGGRRKVPMVL